MSRKLMSRKLIAEYIGTLALVFFGCGTAMLVGCSAADGGYLLTALAFGLTIVAMAYSIGNISGCHVNPAVSLAMSLSGRMPKDELAGYIVSQCLGALCGSLLLKAVFAAGGVTDQTGALGTNGLAGVSGNVAVGLLAETALTFFFVLAVLGVTSEKQEHGPFGGLVIGLSLTLVHIIGIGLTGTSVNPARSIGPAVVAAFAGDLSALACLWVFVIGPFAGAAAAAYVYKYLEAGN